MYFDASRTALRSLGVLAMLLAALATGCSRQTPRLRITGSVWYKGQPVAAGRVRFASTDNRTWIADLRPDGTFVMTDVTPGEVKVAVEDDPRARSSGGREADPAPGEGAKRAPGVGIPPKYKDLKTTDQKVDITPENTNLKIELK
jgi:hypothetical protein